MITLDDVNDLDCVPVLKSLSDLHGTSFAFKVFLQKLRQEREVLRVACTTEADEARLRQYQGAAQVLDDIIIAAESAREIMDGI